MVAGTSISLAVVIGSIFALGLLLGAVSVFVLPSRRRPGDPLRHAHLRSRVKDLAREVKDAKADLVRRREIADRMPTLVKNLTELPPGSAIAQIAVRLIKDFFHASRVGYFSLVEGSKTLTLVAGYGFPKEWTGDVRLAADEGILGMALQKKAVVTREDPLSFAGQRNGGHSLEKAGVLADFAAPVFEGRGTVSVLAAAGCAIDVREEKKYVSAFADLLSLAIQHAALRETMDASMNLDHLTGIADRSSFARRFENEIRRARNYAAPLALLFFDIDDFKKINDAFGHPIGDRVIKELAKTVSASTRTTDLVARYGGDEFVVLMSGADRRLAVIHAEHLRKKIAGMEIAAPGVEAPIRITASIGVSSFPTDGDTTGDLVRAADAALYEAKKAGRNHVALARSQWLDGTIADDPAPESGA